MPKGRFTHGLFSKDSALYTRWNTMVARCERPKAKEYARYRGAGVRVCDDWKDPRKFFEWAYANGWDRSLTLDRIDCRGNYEPDNCRWVTHKQQQRNKSSNRRIDFNDKTMCMVEWAEETGISMQVLKGRFKLGWAPDVALTRPVGRHIKGD